MKMNYVNIAIVILLMLITLFLFFGCVQIQFTTEHFAATNEKDDETNDDMTQKEKELFEDLKDNKLSTEEITDLVKGGVLTEKLVEKFLAQLNVQIEDEVATKKESKTSKAKSSDEDTDDTTVEGFMSGSSQYARVL